MSQWNPIPGETPIDDVSGLRVKGVRDRGTLNALEAENIREAVLKYLAAKPTQRQAPFDLRWVKKLHREMFGKAWKWGGEFRSVELNLGVPAHQIELRLSDLLADLQFWLENKVPMEEQAAMLHHRAVAVHPFLNGNGRWARMLANIWLMRNDHPLTQWPEEHVGGESVIRKKYLAAIRRADGGDYGELIKLHRKYGAGR